MFLPGTYSEGEVLLGYLEQQLVSIRAAAYGLTDAQARETPCRSVLSIGGIVKHAAFAMSMQGGDDSEGPDEKYEAAFLSSFALTADETLASVLAVFDEASTSYLAAVRATDPAADTVSPPAPWDGLDEPTPSVMRFGLVHGIEEFARHAGHADIIREQLDGAAAASLVMAVEGREGNDYIRPWVPAVG